MFCGYVKVACLQNGDIPGLHITVQLIVGETEMEALDWDVCDTKARDNTS